MIDIGISSDNIAIYPLQSKYDKKYRVKADVMLFPANITEEEEIKKNFDKFFKEVKRAEKYGLVIIERIFFEQGTYL